MTTNNASMVIRDKEGLDLEGPKRVVILDEDRSVRVRGAQLVRHDGHGIERRSDNGWDGSELCFSGEGSWSVEGDWHH